VSPPAVRSWATAGPLRLVAQEAPRGEPKALACYGLLVRAPDADGAPTEEAWLRFVDGRPRGILTTAFLDWCCAKLAAAARTALVLIWDNASWHLSREVRRWLGEHNRRAHREGGVRIVPCFLPVKSPWLNPIEPKWTHGQRRIVEPARLLTAREVEERVRAALGCAVHDHLAIPHEVA